MTIKSRKMQNTVCSCFLNEAPPYILTTPICRRHLRFLQLMGAGTTLDSYNLWVQEPPKILKTYGCMNHLRFLQIPGTGTTLDS